MFTSFQTAAIPGDIEGNPGPAQPTSCLNVCHVGNKAAAIRDFIAEYPLDFLALSETWIRIDDRYSIW